MTRNGRACSRCGLAVTALLVCGIGWVAAAQNPARVRVWQDTLQIATYREGPANPNPPFDLLSFGRFNYPYPIRDALTDAREPVSWRALHLENEYLRLTVLPDLGGHVYSCLDKRSGRQMFYANTAIKKALIGYRGAWAAFGIEFNFPVSHNWMSLSPVDFATVAHPDGSGSIWVGNTDRVYGGQWRVELRLEPGRALLEQRTDLYNASDARHRYYWWNNAAVQVWEDSRLVYPTELMATHGFTRIEPWPVDRSGRDLSVIRNQTDGPVSLFTYGTHEGFVGVYHPHTSSGTVHVADPAELPTHKVWSWGYDRDAAEWRTALSDDDSGYVELQSGLFRNQETYGFLEPQERVHFSEQWLPVRDLGGISRANADAIVYMDRPSADRVQIALDVTREVSDAHLAVRNGSAVLLNTQKTLTPREVWRASVDVPALGASTPVTFEVSDASGHRVLAHTENVFDRIPASAAKIGGQPSNRPVLTADDVDAVVETGMNDELEGRRLTAMSRYRSALQKHPSSLALLKAAGRLGVALGWTGSEEARATTRSWLEAALARNTTDFETHYYLGIALAADGRTRDAIDHLQAAQRFRAMRVPATLQLARLLARNGQSGAALDQLRSVSQERNGASIFGGLEVALLRRLGRKADARDRAHELREIDPLSSQLRYELVLLGEDDPSLWTHLGADQARVLDIVDQYLAMGAYDDALPLLARQYPEPPMREPGAVSPNDSPLVAYYRGYVKTRRGMDGAADYRTARTLDTTYVFPNRASAFAVLTAALESDPHDATAQFLIGSLDFAKGLVSPAIAAWQSARRVGTAIPTLHRNLGLALMQPVPDYAEARAVLLEGTAADNRNVEVYTSLDAVLSAMGASARERVDALRRYPVSGPMPPQLVFKLALALADAGDADGAERLFHDRFFPKEEGGTGVRSVYTQVRLASAAAAIASGSCDKALSILHALPREQPGLAFTAGGLTDVIAGPPMQLQIADVEAACGRRESAASRWEKLARALETDSPPLASAIAAAAREHSGRAHTESERKRLDQALASATATLESAGTSSPGLLEYARALLLARLGRAEEARAALKQVFLYPDRGLSHALARSTVH